MASSGRVELREISYDSASIFTVGVTGSIQTSKVNSIIIRVAFSTEDYSVKQVHYDDQNGNGSYMEDFDLKIDDFYEKKFTSFLLGIADRLQVNNNFLVFVGT